MSADARLKSFIDRILRLKEEQDTLATDIREVYAEAKGDGYDKTAMGELVAFLRKVEKKGRDAIAERQTVFDLYLDAYERASSPSHTHARARTSELQDQPETATKFHPPVTTREGHQGDPSPTLGERDLAEVGTGQKRAVLPQEPYTATNHQSTGVLPAGGSSPSASEIDEIAELAQPSPPKQAEPETAGEGVPPLSPAILSDEEVVPAFMKGKPGCLKLRDGHCKISFATEALCAECADKRARAMA